MEKDEANGEIVNLGNPVEFPIIEVAHLVKGLANSESIITFHPLPEDDPKVRRPDIEKAKRLLGWEPFLSLEEGLKLTVKEYRNKLGIE
jgi:UDP-glucuronate decarboxylase